MGSFRPEFLQQLRERVVLSEIIARSVRLTQRGKEKLGLCPFHQEKSPSFTVNDAKGIYYCFGCGANGDAISFLRSSQNLTFVEAVGHLAEVAGLQVEYVQTPHPKSMERQSLYPILEAACCYFEAQLACVSGESVRDYIAQRGVNKTSVQQFRLGFAPASKMTLQTHLKEKGFALGDLLKAGLVGRSQTDGHVYDLFRGRLMFPIMDTQGRVIAFGGRLLAQDTKAPKYLNSPETELFSKKKEVYGLYQAQHNPVLKAKPLVWVEGYMDVISMHQAGLGRAVAPLGTALTEDQILRGWKTDPEPLICMDGDASGQRASFRLAQRVMPLLKPGYSLSFVRLPEGQDPDGLLSTRRGNVLQQGLDTPTPLMDFLWGYQLESLPSRTPEQQALVFQQTKDLVQTIQDTTVRSLYRGVIQQKWQALLQQTRGFASPRFQKKETPRDINPRPLFDSLHVQRKVLLATMLFHPALLEEFSEILATLAFPEPGFETVRNFLLEWEGGTSGDFIKEKGPQYLQEALKAQGLAEVVQHILTSDLYVHAAFCKPETPLDQVRQGWLDVLNQHQRQGALREEFETTRNTLGKSMSEVDWERLQSLRESIFV